MRWAILALALLCAGCSSLAPKGCLADSLGQLQCAGGICLQSFDGEVFYRMAGQPVGVDRMTQGLKLNPMLSHVWYMSSTGKFRLYEGSNAIGNMYEFSQAADGWQVKFEHEPYFCPPSHKAAL